MTTETAANPRTNNVKIARAAYDAYVAKDRAALEALLATDFHFTSALDNHLDRDTYFRRCWPNSKSSQLRGSISSISSPTRSCVRHVRRTEYRRPSIQEHRDCDHS